MEIATHTNPVGLRHGNGLAQLGDFGHRVLDAPKGPVPSRLLRELTTMEFDVIEPGVRQRTVSREGSFQDVT
jgi:hypothetical protein